MLWWKRKDPENEAEKLRMQAFQVEKQDPSGAAQLLMRAAKKYPDAYVTQNLLFDDIIQLCRRIGEWDNAIWACQQAQTYKGDYKEAYVIEENACRLEKQGKHKQALELQLAYERKRGSANYLIFHHFAGQFADSGDNDKAWHLYNEAVIDAAKSERSPHIIRQAMANLLLKEGKPYQAVETLIQGIMEAEKWATKGAPQSLVANLKRALKQCGLEDAVLVDKIVVTCKMKGAKRAIDLFNGYITKK
jgi:hypothetical protein